MPFLMQRDQNFVPQGLQHNTLTKDVAPNIFFLIREIPLASAENSDLSNIELFWQGIRTADKRSKYAHDLSTHFQ